MAKRWSDYERTHRPPRFKKGQLVRLNDEDRGIVNEPGRVVDVETSWYHGVGEAPLVEYRYKVATKHDPTGTLYFGMHLRAQGSAKKSYRRRRKSYSGRR